MTGFNYGRAKATADRMIAKFGQTVTLRQPTTSGPAYDPTTSFTDHEASGVLESYTASEIDGTRIRATDKKLMLAKGALSVGPGLDYIVLIGGEAHNVVSIDVLSPGGVVVMWTLQVRK